MSPYPICNKKKKGIKKYPQLFLTKSLLQGLDSQGNDTRDTDSVKHARAGILAWSYATQSHNCYRTSGCKQELIYKIVTQGLREQLSPETYSLNPVVTCPEK